MGPDYRQQVALFVARARQAAGSERALAEAAREAGHEILRQGVNAWITGRNQPPGFVLFAFARKYGLSLDEFALDDGRPDLQGEVHQLRTHLAIVQEHVQRLLVLQGQEPMEFPKEAQAE